jgi:hypothetical protein
MFMSLIDLNTFIKVLQISEAFLVGGNTLSRSSDV